MACAGRVAGMTFLEPGLLLAASLALGGVGLENKAEARELACLALNVYWESGGEPAKGQAAVAHATLNRVASPRFPDTICGVVAQGMNGRGCQFHWTCDGRPDTPRSEAAFRRSLRIAADALANKSPDPTDGATYFVATRIGRPTWTARLTETAVIGGHRFMRN
jgi:spore germination cell wall hydrolase CwlJ-like protein